MLKMKLKRSNETPPMKQMDCGEKSSDELNSERSSINSTSSSSSLEPTKSKRNRANLPLETKLDKLVTKFDQLIFRHELDFTVIESNFGDKLWTEVKVKVDNFWQCFIGALICKLGFTEDEAYNKDADDETNPTALDDINCKEVEAGWIWWEIKAKQRDDGLKLPSVGDFVGYISKYLDDPDVQSTELENTFLVMAIFIYLYPLSAIREMAQLSNKCILTHLMDQIVDKVNSLQAAIFALFALQRVLQASVLLSEVPNYWKFKEALNDLASFIQDVEYDLNLGKEEDAFRAYQASMLAKVTLQKLVKQEKLSSQPKIKEEHALISLCLRNWFCGTSSGYCNFQMDESVLRITKQRHLYFEMMYLTTGSIKVGICNNLVRYFKKEDKKDGKKKGRKVDCGYDMTTCTHTFCFDGYQKESSRDGQDNIPMVVCEIKAGSVVGIRLDTLDRTVTYYLNGEEVKEKRKKKSNRTKGKSRSWESNPYYVTISLAAMQQATILLTKEEWLKPPKFAHELHELFYDNWQFRMVR